VFVLCHANDPTKITTLARFDANGPQGFFKIDDYDTTLTPRRPIQLMFPFPSA